MCIRDRWDIKELADAIGVPSFLEKTFQPPTSVKKGVGLLPGLYDHNSCHAPTTLHAGTNPPSKKNSSNIKPDQSIWDGGSGYFNNIVNGPSNNNASAKQLGEINSGVKKLCSLMQNGTPVQVSFAQTNIPIGSGATQIASLKPSIDAKRTSVGARVRLV
jgi:hypothetical protein